MKNISIILVYLFLTGSLFQSRANIPKSLELPSASTTIETATDYIIIHFKGRKAGGIEFSGFRPSLEEWCPQLPFDRDGLMFPDNFCGLLIRYVSTIQWWDESGKRIGDERNIPSINGSQYYLDGIEIMGAFESCRNPSGWKFPYPLTGDGKPPFNATTLVMEVEYPQNTIYHPAIEFLKSNGALMELADLHSREVPNKKEWLQRICDKYPDYCVEPKPVKADLSDHPFGTNHPIHVRARQMDSRPLHFPMYLIPLSEILKTKDKNAEYQAFKFMGDGGKLTGISGNRMRIYYHKNRRIAIEVYGKILSYWKSRNYEKGGLGYPRTRIKKLSNGGFYSVFENNVVYAHSSGNASTAKNVSALRSTLPGLISNLASGDRREKMAAHSELTVLSRKIWYADVNERQYIGRLKSTLKEKIEEGNAQRSVKIEFQDIQFETFHKWKTVNKSTGYQQFRVMEFRVKFKPVNIPVTSEFSVYVRIYPHRNSLYAQVVHYDQFEVDYDVLNLPVILLELSTGSPRGVKKLLWSEIKKRLDEERKTFKVLDSGNLPNFNGMKTSIVATHPQEKGAVRIYFYVNRTP